MMDRYIKIGDIAQKLGVCVKTVTKLIDTGQLKGTKVTGGRHRRVTVHDFMTFCRKNRIGIEGVSTEEISPEEIEYRRGAREVIECLISKYDFSGSGQDALRFLSRCLETLKSSAEKNDPKYLDDYIGAVFDDLATKDDGDESKEIQGTDISF